MAAISNPPIIPVLLSYGWEDRRWGYGEWQNTRCPFHPDTHASGRLNEQEGVFKCMACGITGNAVKLIQEHEGVTYDEAKRKARELTGVEGNDSIASRPGGHSKLPLWTRERRGTAGRSGRRLSGSNPRGRY